MFDGLIRLELKSIFFAKEYVNILSSVIISVLLMFVLYQHPNKDWLVFFTGILIIWERILLLKIRRIKSSK